MNALPESFRRRLPVVVALLVVTAALVVYLRALSRMEGPRRG